MMNGLEHLSCEEMAKSAASRLSGEDAIGDLFRCISILEGKVQRRQSQASSRSAQYPELPSEY